MNIDEATANVDPENEAELTKAIEELTRNKTIIMIAHRLKTVRHADQIVVVADGKVAQLGTHDELINRDGIYRYFTELGTPELTKIFCINDECTYGDIPGLEFIRHTTLGTGGDKCDFHIRVSK